MSEIWPLHVVRRMQDATQNNVRPFNCLMFMPFEKRFDNVAEAIRETVAEVLKSFDMHQGLENDLPRIERLDWVTTSGVINEEIWQKLVEADLVFCDITGYNPNVMFELGVTAALKEMQNVVMIKDRFFKQTSAFDIAPIRYTEYEITSDGIQGFREKVAKHTVRTLLAYPDLQGSSPIIDLPFESHFENNRDDPRIYTPPFAHRRIISGQMEFGSKFSYPHSWASIGKHQFQNFDLEFTASFSNPHPESWIGVALRSQHYWANYSHLLYLRNDGAIVLTQPDEQPPNLYHDMILRNAQAIDPLSEHLFRVSFDDDKLFVKIDDFERSFPISEMPKVLWRGLIRFQSWRTWMIIKRFHIQTR